MAPLLLTFEDSRLENPYLRLHEGSLRRFDAPVWGMCSILTLLALAGLSSEDRVSFPAWMRRANSGDVLIESPALADAEGLSLHGKNSLAHVR